MNSPIKIDNAIKKAGNLNVGTTPNRSTKGADSAEKAVPLAKTPTDNVSLSTQAQAVSGQMSGSGVFDTKKVEEIKAAIADGTFKVDPEKVANGLLDTVTDLLHSRKPQK